MAWFYIFSLSLPVGQTLFWEGGGGGGDRLTLRQFSLRWHPLFWEGYFLQAFRFVASRGDNNTSTVHHIFWLSFFSFRYLTQTTSAMKYHWICPVASLHLRRLTTTSPCKAVPLAFSFQGRALESFCEKCFQFWSLSVISINGVSSVFQLALFTDCVCSQCTSY